MMKLKIPKALKTGHEILFRELETLIDLGGHIGEKAKVLNDVMAPHFKKEEMYALPPLGLLLTLSEGNWELDTNEAIKMSEMLESKLSELNKEHGNILKVLNDLKHVAKEENNNKAKQFVKDLMLHIDIEDQVLYPATILVGNYLKKMKANLK